MSDDVDSLSIVSRPAGRREIYDPNVLVVEIQKLLRDHGLHPDSGGRAGMALGACGNLLRAFGILPASDLTTIDRLNAPDADA
jgi:hypothetical protein